MKYEFCIELRKVNYMVISKLKPGMKVYEVKRATGFNVFNSKWQTWTIIIEEVDAENEKVKASWNSNRSEWFYKNQWSKWRLKIPE
jgi:hypothetical protein